MMVKIILVNLGGVILPDCENRPMKSGCLTVFFNDLFTKNIAMLTNIHPKLPMRDKYATRNFYLNKLGFTEAGDYGDYLMLKKDSIEIHFFEFTSLDPKENYGQVYIRTDDIETLYKTLLECKTDIHPNGKLQIRPWGQKEFSLLDPDNNLLTFGQSI